MRNALLVEICNDLAPVRDKAEVIMVVNTKLRKLIDFSHSVIGLLNPFTNALDLTAPGGELLMDHEIMSLLQKAGVPRQFSITDCPGCFSRLSRGWNVSSVAVVALKKRETTCFGCLILFRQTSEPLPQADLDLLAGIADQLSITVDNILMRADIRRRESERSLLLSFSNHLATVSDINGLKYMIKQYLKQIFGIKEYIITIKNADDHTYSYFLHDLATDDPTDEGFKIITGSSIPIAGDITGTVLRSDDPVIFNVKDVKRAHKYSFPSASFWKAAGAENILGIRLKVAEKDIGILWLQPGQTNERLLKGISAQIALSISHALACNEIERQMEEIRCYKKRLEGEKIFLPEEHVTNHLHSGIIGTGSKIQKVYELVQQVAFSDSTVLIMGETGTGKELIARAIHANSYRKDKGMIRVNCATIPANLVESELFGHERGSFTGAVDRKMGKFELADNSTLFLDEIGELPSDLQVKLLRAIQEREIERVGGRKTIKVNVRIVAATNRDLEKEVAEGRFRRDLYYRLNVFPIFMPPLRDRLEDIPLLVSHFIQKLAGRTGKKMAGICTKALIDLMKYNWPGNIRELENCVERSLLMSDRSVIERVELPAFGGLSSKVPGHSTITKTLYENERDHIITVLKRCNGKIGGNGGAAEILDVNTSTLHSRIRKLGIKKGRSFGQTDHE